MEKNKSSVISAKPELEIDLMGEGGNAFAILGKASKELRKIGKTKEEINQFYTEATSGDYNHLLDTVKKHFEVV